MWQLEKLLMWNFTRFFWFWSITIASFPPSLRIRLSEEPECKSFWSKIFQGAHESCVLYCISFHFPELRTCVGQRASNCSWSFWRTGKFWCALNTYMYSMPVAHPVLCMVLFDGQAFWQLMVSFDFFVCFVCLFKNDFVWNFSGQKENKVVLVYTTYLSLWRLVLQVSIQGWYVYTNLAKLAERIST